MNDKEYSRILNILDKEGSYNYGTDNNGEDVYLVKKKDLKYIPTN